MKNLQNDSIAKIESAARTQTTSQDLLSKLIIRDIANNMIKI